MKKIAIMLLSAMVIFSFVACNNNGTAAPNDYLEAVAGSTSIAEVMKPDETASNIQRSVYIDENGKVFGRFYKSENNTAWNTDNEEESGYYIAFTVTEDVTLSSSNTMTIGSGDSQKVLDDASDLPVVVWLGGDAAAAKAKTYPVKIGDTTINLNFSSITIDEN